MSGLVEGSETCACCTESIGAQPALRHTEGRTRAEVAAAKGEGRCCGHAFHASCLTQWVLTCLIAGKPPSCPLCRGDLSAVLEEHCLLKRSAHTDATRVCSALVRYAIQNLGFPVPDAPLALPGETHPHPFVRLLVQKHANDVSSAWPLHERMRNRFVLQLDVLLGVESGATLIVELWHMMGCPMIYFHVAFVVPGAPIAGRGVGLIRAVYNVVLETLRLPEAMDNLRALRFADVHAAHHSVAVRTATAVEMVAMHGGAYAAHILARLRGEELQRSPARAVSAPPVALVSR